MRKLILTALETGPDTMIEPSFHPFSFNPSFAQGTKHLLRYFGTPNVREFFFVVMVRESIEAEEKVLVSSISVVHQKKGKWISLIDQLRHFGRVDLDRISACLPMR